ncbi:MAG: 4-hydroxy-tetrahydrodipicolinate synthase [Deltaproteobacteria bacterium]|nr:4-hydroxy-tetrahydrodipicolinate synthase [Deltaproteobacteria bacterium]
MAFEGVITALVTPFRDGAVDLPAFGALVERQIRAGVHGLVPCGTTGEAPTLSEAEWRSVVETCLRVAAGRVPVTAGCGTYDTAHSVHRCRVAREVGADAALVVTPYYNKPPPAGLEAHVRACAAEGLPLVLYHIPGRTGLRLSAAVLADLCAIPGVAAVKEASGDVAYADDLLPRVRVPVLSGDDGLFLPLLAVGGSGVVSVLSNVAPQATVALWEAARSGDLREATRLHRQLVPLVRWLFHVTNPIPAKAALAALGLCRDECRLPLLAVAGELPPSVRALMEA